MNDEKMDNDVKNRFAGYINKIINPSFIAQLLLINDIVVDVSKAEKAAQATSFGPFSYCKVVNNLKESLSLKLKTEYENIKSLVETGVFSFKFVSKRQKKNINVNLTEFKISKNMRIDDNNSVNLAIKLINLFKVWVGDILENFDNFLSIPQEIHYVNNVFSKDSKLSFNEKVYNVKNLFSSLNIEFNNCNDNCTGINDCACILDEFNRFHEHYIKKLNIDCQNKNYDYTEILGFHLSNENWSEIIKIVSFNRSCFAIESMTIWNRERELCLRLKR